MCRLSAAYYKINFLHLVLPKKMESVTCFIARIIVITSPLADGGFFPGTSPGRF